MGKDPTGKKPWSLSGAMGQEVIANNLQHLIEAVGTNKPSLTLAQFCVRSLNR